MSAKITQGVSLVEIFYKAKELEKQGHDIIHFDAGEPDFGPPTEVIEATIRALRSGKGHYTQAAGIPEARQAIAEHLSKKYPTEVSSKQVLLTPGGRMALYYAFNAIKSGGRIGIVSPDWPAYRDLSKLMSLKTQYFECKLENSWTPDIEEIEKSDCDAIVLNYPNNPTGKILDRATFESIVDIANRKGMIVISDEVYSDYIFSESKNFKSVLESKCDRYVFTTSLSKSYAMTGFRVGYIVSDEETISKLEKINSLVMTSVAEFIQYGVIAALQCQDYVRQKVVEIKRRREVASKALRQYVTSDFYEPDGSLYVFPRIGSPGKFDSEKFTLELLNTSHVSVTPGTSFGEVYREYIRITLLQSEDRIREGIERIGNQLGQGHSGI